MKRVMLIAALFVAALMTMNVYAQQSGDTAGTYGADATNEQGMHQQGMMHSGMMGGRGMQGTGMMGQGMMGMQSNPLGSPDLYLQHTDHLELNETQIDELKELRIEQVRETTEMRSAVHVAQLELDDLMDADVTDIRAIGDKVHELHELHADLQVANLEYGAKARELLTAGQRELADELTGRHMRGSGQRGNRQGTMSNQRGHGAMGSGGMGR